MRPVLVAGAAQQAHALIAAGEAGSEALWCFGVLQLLDDYDSTLRHDGPAVAAQMFALEPSSTSHSGLDAAFAALAIWLAQCDGWTAPLWALAESPGEFRIRGVFITGTALARA